MKLIERPLYLDELISLLGTPDIKVITGIRRCGKSKMLEALAAHLKKNDPKANIIHINYNLTDYETIAEYHALEKYVEDKYKARKNNYLLIDEVQMCNGFEKAVNSLYAKQKYDIFITGSNAFLQSSDLATLFVGRTYEVHIFPFSFNEYLKYYPSKNIYESFSKYLTEGGMAGSYLYKTERQKYNYINNEVFNALIVRDIKKKYKIRHGQLLDNLIDFLVDNAGNMTSVRNICETLISNKDRYDHKTVGKYLKYLCRAFAFYMIRKYDIRGKKYLRNEAKYYLCDHSFKYARLGTKDLDLGHMLENIVAIELLRRGYELYAGKLFANEIDFVAQKQGEKIYFQVAYDISEKKTFEREISPLLKINDAYPKILLSRTYRPPFQHEGVKIIDIADWLSANL